MSQDPKQDIVGGYILGDFIRKLQSSETKYNTVKPEYDKCTKYFENSQTPSGTPSDKTYVEDNLVTDLVRYLIGQVVGGGMKPELVGAGEMGDVLAALHDDVLKKNFFKARIVPKIAKSFYTVGLSGVVVDFKIGDTIGGCSVCLGSGQS